jgi:hypothetical protein
VRPFSLRAAFSLSRLTSFANIVLVYGRLDQRDRFVLLCK